MQEDLDRRQLSARERTQGIQEKLQSIPDPIHLAGCHTLSKGFFIKIFEKNFLFFSQQFYSFPVRNNFFDSFILF